MATFDAAAPTRRTAGNDGATSPFTQPGVASSSSGSYPVGYATGYTAGLADAPPPSSPTVAIVSPAPGAIAGDLATAQQTPIVVDVDKVGAFAVAFIVAVVRFPGELVERVAYRRGSFRRGFTAHSYAETIGTKTRLHILPDGGWPDSGDSSDIVIDVDAAAGAVSDIGGSS